jgi:hypothetical protein
MVAVRGPLSSSESSPKYEPGPSRDLAAVALDLHLAVHEHEALTADVALLDEGAPLGDVDLVRCACDPLQVLT